MVTSYSENRIAPETAVSPPKYSSCKQLWLMLKYSLPVVAGYGIWPIPYMVGTMILGKLDDQDQLVSYGLGQMLNAITYEVGFWGLNGCLETLVS